MINPFQLLVNIAVITLLSFTHFQAFRLGRASMDNIFTRWLGDSTKTEICTEGESEKSWLEELLGETEK
jgi:hypothetical protein